jgi:hypothetical protein
MLLACLKRRNSVTFRDGVDSGRYRAASETKVRQNVGRTLVVYAPKVSRES